MYIYWKDRPFALRHATVIGRIPRTGRAATQKENQRKTANPSGRAKRLTAAIQAAKRIRRALFPFFSHGSKVSEELGIADAQSHYGKHYSHPDATVPFIFTGGSNAAKRIFSLRVESIPPSSDSGCLGDHTPNLLAASSEVGIGYGDPVPGSDDDESSFDDSEVENTSSFLQPGHAPGYWGEDVWESHRTYQSHTVSHAARITRTYDWIRTAVPRPPAPGPAPSVGGTPHSLPGAEGSKRLEADPRLPHYDIS
ncbi:hypothetical protein B0H13DRAFT_1861689 [Mycena leptocephala]|nr:hypothetical protein B0H13DRAFT_1861689 [Mycena leptocephala]